MSINAIGARGVFATRSQELRADQTPSRALGGFPYPPGRGPTGPEGPRRIHEQSELDFA